MFRRSIIHLSIVAAGLALAACSLHAGAQDNSRQGRKYKVPPQSSRIEVSVLRDADGRPIDAAAVIFHPIENDRDKGILELKTNPDGKAIIDVIPIGDLVRLQIIAKGFKTYGRDFKVDKDSISIEIRMKRPGEQYSIYKQSVDAGESAPPEKPVKPAAKEAAVPSQPQPATN